VSSEILGLVAASCILASAFPQLRRLLRAPGDGVSVTSWALLLACNVVWLSYGVSIGSASVIVGNLAGALAFAAVVVTLLFQRSRSLLQPALVIPAAVALFVATNTLPTGVAGAVGVILGISLALPQLLVSYRSSRHRTPSTVAIGSWLLIFAGQVLWLGYGLLESQLAIIVVNIVAATISAAVLTLEIGHRRRRRDPLVYGRGRTADPSVDDDHHVPVPQNLNTGRRSN
jgi:uncharacterized protein with PQ loop repeat